MSKVMSLGLGENIRALRKERGLTQEALAREIGMTLNVVHRLERGSIRDPHLSTLMALVDGLGARTIDDLLNGGA